MEGGGTFLLSFLRVILPVMEAVLDLLLSVSVYVFWNIFLLLVFQSVLDKLFGGRCQDGKIFSSAAASFVYFSQSAGNYKGNIFLKKTSPRFSNVEFEFAFFYHSCVWLIYMSPQNLRIFWWKLSICQHLYWNIIISPHQRSKLHLWLIFILIIS